MYDGDEGSGKWIATACNPMSVRTLGCMDFVSSQGKGSTNAGITPLSTPFVSRIFMLHAPFSSLNLPVIIPGLTCLSAARAIIEVNICAITAHAWQVRLIAGLVG